MSRWRSLFRSARRYFARHIDGLSNLPLPAMIDHFRSRDAVACFVGVAPTQSFHLVNVKDGGRVKSIRHVKNAGMRMNGGYYYNSVLDCRMGLFWMLNQDDEYALVLCIAEKRGPPVGMRAQAVADLRAVDLLASTLNVGPTSMTEDSGNHPVPAKSFWLHHEIDSAHSPVRASVL